MNPETKDTQTHDKLSDAGRAQLLGFGILALLAVIFLPIILDGHPESNSETQEANHALAIDEDALPNAEILEEYEDLIILPESQAPAVAVDPSIHSLDVAVAEQAVAEQAVAEQAVAEQAVAEQAVAEQAVAEQAVAEQAVAEQAVDDGAQMTPSAESTPSLIAEAWVIQVGSFATLENAERVNMALKKRNYRAFVESVRIRGNDIYRVRVGPEIERERIKLLEKRLRAEKFEGGMSIDTKIYPWTPRDA